MKEQFQTPILYLMFNRPDLVKQTFPQIKAQRPKNLFIASDGPRADNNEDIDKCQDCREWVLSQIDWECEVKTLFRDENLGCDTAVVESINWFFDYVESGVILEDDCLVSGSFFQFCDLLLLFYKNNNTVMHISGDNFQDQNDKKVAYYFSHYTHSWGWATWRDRWNKFISNYEGSISLSMVKTMNQDQIKFWENYIQKTYSNPLSPWDVKWQYTVFVNQGVSILPSVNLVTNIGSVGTHYSGDSHGQEALFIPNHEILDFRLSHGNEIKISKKMDDYTFDHFYQSKVPPIQKLKRWLYLIMKKLKAQVV